jgi:hypothetical protein
MIAFASACDPDGLAVGGGALSSVAVGEMFGESVHWWIIAQERSVGKGDGEDRREKKAIDFRSIGGYSLSMKTKNVYYSERQAQCYKGINENGGVPSAFGGGFSLMTLNQIRLDDDSVVTYTEISDGDPSGKWGDYKFIGTVTYDNIFPYSRCTTKGYW